MWILEKQADKKFHMTRFDVISIDDMLRAGVKPGTCQFCGYTHALPYLTKALSTGRYERFERPIRGLESGIKHSLMLTTEDADTKQHPLIREIRHVRELNMRKLVNRHRELDDPKPFQIILPTFNTLTMMWSSGGGDLQFNMEDLPYLGNKVFYSTGLAVDPQERPEAIICKERLEYVDRKNIKIVKADGLI